MVLGAIAGAATSAAIGGGLNYLAGRQNKPSVPDPGAVSDAQYGQNRRATTANMTANTYEVLGPSGGTFYNFSADGSPLSQTTMLNRNAQAAYDNAELLGKQLSQKALNAASHINTSPLSTQTGYQAGSYNTDLRKWRAGDADQYALQRHYRQRGLMPEAWKGAQTRFDPGNVGRGQMQKLWGGYQGAFDPSSERYQSDAERLRGAHMDQATNAGAARKQSRNLMQNSSGRPQKIADKMQGGYDAYRADVEASPFNPQSYGELNNYRGDVEKAHFDRQMSLMEPGFEEARSDLTQSLADRGIAVGSDAYNRAMGGLNREQAASRERLADQAVLAGGAEAERQLGMEQKVNNAAFNQQRALYSDQSSATQTQLAAQQQGFDQDRQSIGDIYSYGSARTGAQAQGVQQATAYEQGLNNAARAAAIEDHRGINDDRAALIGQKMNLYGMQRDAATNDFNMRNASKQALRGTEQQLLDQQRARTQQDVDIYNKSVFDQASLNQSTHAAMMGDRQTRRNSPINMISSLATQTPAVNMPSAPALPTYSMSAPDMAGLANNQYAAYSQQAQSAAQNRLGAINAGLNVGAAAYDIWGGGSSNKGSWGGLTNKNTWGGSPVTWG